MEEFGNLIWDWFGVAENRDRSTAIATAIGTIITALLFLGTFLAWFGGLFRRRSGDGQSANGGSANIGGNVGGDVMTGGNKAEGGAAAVSGNVSGNLTIGYTPEQHEAALQRRLDELRTDLEAKQAALVKVAATEQELLRRDLDQLQQEKAEVERRQGDLDTSYSEAATKIRELEALLVREGSEIGGDRLAEARAALEQGDFSKAEPLFRQAMEIGENTIGTAHPEYASGLNNLAGLLRDMGRFDEAEPLFRQAIEIDAKTIGTEHPDYAIRLNNLAGLLRAMGRFDEAEPLLRQAQEIFRAKLGPDHPNTKVGEANYAGFIEERDGSVPN